MTRRVALTGASGFVGQQVVRALANAGWHVTAIARAESGAQRLATLDGSVTVRTADGSVDQLAEILADVQPELCVHLASLFIAEHKPAEVSPLIRSNVEFGACLLEAMHLAGVRRLINTGTSWQHFGDAEYNPVCLYAATKQAFEALIEYFVQARGLQAITLTLFDTYGPGDPRPKLIPNLLRSLRQGVELGMSPGEQEIDLLHVDDVARAFLVAAQRFSEHVTVGHERFAVRFGRSIALRELVALLGQLSGIEPRVVWGARPYRQREIMRPWSGGEPLPGWQPKVSLRAGLQELIAAAGAA